jgi:hypothetical protein
MVTRPTLRGLPCDDHGVEYPELAARTKGFRAGEPRAVTVGSDGARVVFLRSSGPEDAVDRLWVFDVATGQERLVADPAELAGPADEVDLPPAERALRERLRLTASGIGSYATDPQARVAACALGGSLVVADLVAGTAAVRATNGPVVDPRPDPTASRVAYVSDGVLRVLNLTTGEDSLLAAEPGNDNVTWGLAEFIGAEEFGRYRGYWWSPDGVSVLAARVDNTRVRRWHLHDPAEPDEPPTTVAYPAAGTANAEVTLHLLDLDGGWVDVHWDRETYPYLVAVSWTEVGGPLVTVLRRLQQHGLVLAVDPRTGETQVHAELADPRWVEPVPGSPAYLSDGRVLIGGELAHDGYDARCLFADGGLPHPGVALRTAGLRPPRGRTCWSRRVTASRASSTSTGSAPGRGHRRSRSAASPPTRAGTSGTPVATRSWSARAPSTTPASGGPSIPDPTRSAGSDHWRRCPRTRRVRRWSGSPTAGCRPGCSTRAATSAAASCRSWSTSTAGPGTRRSWPPATCGCAGSGGPTPGTRSWSSTTGAPREWRRRSRRSCTGGWPTSS